MARQVRRATPQAGRAARTGRTWGRDRAALDSLWAGESRSTRRVPQLEAQAAELQAKLEQAAVTLERVLAAAAADRKEAEAEVAKYKAVAEPGKKRFFVSGHFSAAVDLASIEALTLGLARGKVRLLGYT